MTNIIVALTILLIIGSAIFRIIMEKRKGIKCVGCHLSGSCPANKRTKSRILAQKKEGKE